MGTGILEIKSPDAGTFVASQGDFFTDSVSQGLLTCMNMILGHVVDEKNKSSVIKIKVAGKVTEAMVKNMEKVEKGQVILKIEPLAQANQKPLS